MLFPSEYPELQSAPTTPMTTRMAAGALAIALSISGYSALSDADEYQVQPAQGEQQQTTTSLG